MRTSCSKEATNLTLTMMLVLEKVEDIEKERMMDEGPYSQHSNWSILDAAAREAELGEGKKPLTTIAEIMVNPKVSL
jgi:hypothetical protein